jgi:hypothetical protein
LSDSGVDVISVVHKLIPGHSWFAVASNEEFHSGRLFVAHSASTAMTEIKILENSRLCFREWLSSAFAFSFFIGRVVNEI